ncbi:hypothetical protein ACQ4M3_01090 [Leptolyngbya sp. AN03gr2]|uniref:hypothetical protein n=1 Tax=unclassified Leptolyngbya TaxID=2650499 RepID=UPI003D322B33
MARRVINFGGDEQFPSGAMPGSPEWNDFFGKLKQRANQHSGSTDKVAGDERVIIGDGNYSYTQHIEGDYVQGNTSFTPRSTWNENTQANCSNSANYTEQIRVHGRVIKGDMINGVAGGDSYAWDENNGAQAPGTAAYSINPLTPDSPCYKALLSVALSPENPENVVRLYQYMKENYPEVAADEAGNDLEEDEFWEKTLEFVETIGLRIV